MRRKLILISVVGLLVATITFARPAAAAENSRIVLHLRWDHQFQFAGYYAALWQGYYRDAGLNVDIRSAFGSDGRLNSAIDAVANGEADFGVGSADILTAIDAGKPLKIVMPIFQQSPYAFFALKDQGLSSPIDMLDRSIALRGTEGVLYAELFAMLRSEGLDPSRVRVTEPQRGIAIFDLINGRTSLAAGSILSAGWIAEANNLSLTSISAAGYGIDFYGDAIFTSQNFARKNLELVHKFAEASVRGWQYALSSSDEVADRISRTMPRVVPVDDVQRFNRFQIDPVKRLVRYPAAPIGHSNPERWHMMARILGEAGLTSGRWDSRAILTFPGDAGTDWMGVFWPVLLFVVISSNVLIAWHILRDRRRNGQKFGETLREIVDGQLKNFVEESTSPISIRDGNARYIYCNRAWEEWTGLIATAVRGKKLSEIEPAPFDAETIRRDEERHFEVFDTGFPLKYETSTTRRDGRIASVLANRFPIFDRTGKTSGVALVLNDVTVHRSIERERDSLEAQLKTFIDHAPFMVTIRDTQGRYIVCNRAWEIWTGHTQEEARTAPSWHEPTDPNHPLYGLVQMGRERLESVVANGESVVYEVTQSSAMNKGINLAVTRFPIRNAQGEIVAIGTISQDRSDLIRMSAEREALQAQMHAFIEHAPFTIAIRDREGNYQSVNKQWERIIGVPSGQVLGRKSWEIITNPDDPLYPIVQEDQVRFRQIIEEGCVRSEEKAFVNAAGIERPFFITRFPIRNIEGAIIGMASIMQDLSEQHRLDEARARSEAQLRAFIDHAPFLVTVRDMNGRYLICNKPWMDWTGLTIADFNGRPAWDIFEDPDHPMYLSTQWDKEQFRKVVMTGEAVRSERTHIAPDGRQTQFSSIRFPIRDENGAMIAVGNIMADQTEVYVLGKAQEALESQFKAFIQNAPISVSITDVEGRYLAVNRSFASFDGTPAIDLSRKLPSDYAPPELAASIMQLNRDVLSHGQSLTREFQTTTKDGRSLTLSMTKFPLRDGSGKIVALGAFCSDVTEARRVEQSIEASESRYRALAEMSPEPIIVHKGMTILYANAIAGVWAGLPSGSDLVGRSLNKFVRPADLEKYKDVREAVAANPRSTAAYELRIYVRDQTVDVAITSAPIQFDGVDARMLVVRDVSTRKQMEAQLLQNAKLATIGELSAGILHELAQPLNIARMAAQTALRRIRRGNGMIENPEVEFELIGGQMERMANVIDHMRVFSRAEDPTDEIFDARDAIRAAVDLVRQPFTTDDVQIEITLPSRRSLVYGHAIALEQVILNLLANARDAILSKPLGTGATERGGKINILLKLLPDQRQMEITVADTGGGIPMEIMPQLFDPFVTTKPAGRGTGLGLSVCRTIVTGMNGELSAENVQGGARFVIKLPFETLDRFRDEARRIAEETPPDVDQFIGHGYSVLVVDDEPDALQLMADFFEELGFDVRTAPDGEAGMRRFRESTPSLVVTDIRLPLLDGIELARHVRECAPDLPIVFVTGHLGMTEKLTLLGTQANIRMMHKPIDLNQLEEAVADIFRNNTKVVDPKTIN